MTITPEVLRQKRPLKSVTMAKASLTLYAVNDLLIGPKSHGSARYTLYHGTQHERHSFNGVIVSTGLGSTGWFSSLMAGAQGLMAGIGQADREDSAAHFPKLTWDTPHLVFHFARDRPESNDDHPTRLGRVNDETPLLIESHMPERGVIFSDGLESDFLEFNSRTRAEIQVADRQGMLVA